MKNSIMFFILLLITNVYCQNEFDFDEMASTMSKKLRTIFEKYIKGNTDINVECQSDLLTFLNGLENGETWALKMLDASAKVSSGILEGNTQNLGFFDECVGINEKLGSIRILGQYCLLKNIKPSIGFSKKLQISRAVCLPSTCSIVDIGVFLNQFNVSTVLSKETCQTQNTFTVDTTSWIIMVFFGSILVLMVASTIYDVIIVYIYKENGSTLLCAFSILKNGKNVFTPAQNNREISCVYGIRAFSVIWVILFHMYFRWKYYAIINQTETFKNFVEHKYDLSMGGTKSIDTFLLLSGIMVTYGFLSTAEKFEFNLFKFYARRFFRLTPPLAAIVLAEIGLVKFFGSGPNWYEIFSELQNKCIEDWWRTIFYINNFGNSKCVLQSWYLSVDMQLYMLSPAILLLLHKKPKLGLCFIVFLLLCVMVTGFTITWIYDLPVNVIHDTKLFLYLGKYYNKFYTRAGPWLIGIIVGYIIYKTKQSKSRVAIKPLLATFLWVLSAVILVLCGLFQLESNDVSLKMKLRNGFYNAVNTPLWAIALAWVIFASHFGHGGIVNHFLSLPIFQVLSKLSYSNFLTHIIILNVYQGRMRSPINFSNADIVYIFWGIFMYTQIASIILTLSFELPAMVIEKWLFAPKPISRKSIEMP